MNNVMVTVKGYVAKDPKLFQSASGVWWAMIRVGSTPTYQDKNGKYVDGDTMWFSVRLFADKARNLAESVHRGTPVLIHGRLAVREYDFTREERSEVGAVSEVTSHRFDLCIENATVAVDTSRGVVRYAKLNHTDKVPESAPVVVGAAPEERWATPGELAAPEGEDACDDEPEGVEASE